MEAPAAWMDPVEGNVRVYVHDGKEADHEKDFKTLVAFPPQRARHLVLHFKRIDYFGNVKWTTIVGADVKDPSKGKHGWGQISRGPLRLLIPPPGETFSSIPTDAAAMKTSRKELVAIGWEALLDARPAGGSPVSVAQVQHCDRCRKTEKERLFTPEKVIGASRPLTARKRGIKRPSHWMARLASVLAWTTRYGEHFGSVSGGSPVLQQVFSSNHELTRLWNAAGEIASPPLGMFQDPWVRRTVQVDQDLLNPLVHNRIREEAKSGPANIWYMSPPAATFAPVQRLNGGTRTWAQPRGEGAGALAPYEDVETELVDFTGRLSVDLLSVGKELIVEGRWPNTSGPSPFSLSGSMRRLANHSRARFLRYRGCEFPEPSADGATLHHYRDVGLLVTNRLHPFLQHLERYCSGNHEHSSLGGRGRRGPARGTEFREFRPMYHGAVVDAMRAAWGRGPRATAPIPDLPDIPEALQHVDGKLVGIPSSTVSQAPSPWKFPDGVVGASLPDGADYGMSCPALAPRVFLFTDAPADPAAYSTADRPSQREWWMYIGSGATTSDNNLWAPPLASLDPVSVPVSLRAQQAMWTQAGLRLPAELLQPVSDHDHSDLTAFLPPAVAAGTVRGSWPPSSPLLHNLRWVPVSKVCLQPPDLAVPHLAQRTHAAVLSARATQQSGGGGGGG